MNKTYAIIIVLVVIVGAVFLIGKNKKLEAPSDVGNEVGTEQEGVVSNGMPIIGGDVQEKIVIDNSAPTVKEFTVIGKNFSFAPSTIKVKKGDTVKITFKNEDGFHDFKIDEFNVSTKQIKGGAQETVEFVADKVGSFEYYCSVGSHRAMGMKGVLVVE